VWFIVKRVIKRKAAPQSSFELLESVDVLTDSDTSQSDIETNK
jgi:hypothetical protein